MRLLIGFPLLTPPLHGVGYHNHRVCSGSFMLCEPSEPPPLPRRLRHLAAHLRAADGERDRTTRLIRLGDTMPLAPM